MKKFNQSGKLKFLVLTWTFISMIAFFFMVINRSHAQYNPPVASRLYIALPTNTGTPSAPVWIPWNGSGSAGGGTASSVSVTGQPNSVTTPLAQLNNIALSFPTATATPTGTLIPVATATPQFAYVTSGSFSAWNPGGVTINSPVPLMSESYYLSMPNLGAAGQTINIQALELVNGVFVGSLLPGQKNVSNTTAAVNHSINQQVANQFVIIPIITPTPLASPVISYQFIGSSQ